MLSLASAHGIQAAACGVLQNRATVPLLQPHHPYPSFTAFLSRFGTTASAALHTCTPLPPRTPAPSPLQRCTPLHASPCFSSTSLYPFTPSGGRVTWRSLTRVASLRRAPPHVMRQLASAAVFAVAVAAEFPGRKRDETASSTCEARRYPPSFAASWSSSSALSQTWSAASCAVVTSLPLPFPLRRITHPPVHSVVNAHLSPQTVALCGPD